MNDPDKEWIKKNNAIPLGMTVFKLIVQVKPNTSAVLRKVTVETISIEQVDGIALIRPIGGPVVALNLAVDLDKGSVTCRDSRDFPNSRDVDIDFNITQESPLVLRECGSATTRAVSWKLKLHFLVDGRRVFKHVPADTAITVPNDYRGIRRTYVGSDEWVEVRE